VPSDTADSSKVNRNNAKIIQAELQRQFNKLSPQEKAEIRQGRKARMEERRKSFQ